MRQKGNELCKEGYDYTTLQSDMLEMVMLIEGRMCVCVCVCVCVFVCVVFPFSIQW